MGLMDETEGDLHRFPRDDGGLGGDEGGLNLGKGGRGQECRQAEEKRGQEKEAGEAHGWEVGGEESEAQTGRIVPAAEAAMQGR
jgi:hypothetical protein